MGPVAFDSGESVTGAARAFGPRGECVVGLGSCCSSWAHPACQPGATAAWVDARIDACAEPRPARTSQRPSSMRTRVGGPGASEIGGDLLTRPSRRAVVRTGVWATPKAAPAAGDDRRGASKAPSDSDAAIHAFLASRAALQAGRDDA